MLTPLLNAIELLVFTLHLIAVDAAAVLPLFCVVIAYFSRRGGSPTLSDVGRRLAGWSVGLLLIGAVLGLLAAGLLAVAGEERFFAGFERIPPSRIGFGIAEFAFSLVTMFAYRQLWTRRWFPFWAHSLLAVAASTNLLYHFPVLFTVIATAGTTIELPKTASGHVDVVRVMLVPENVARLAHHGVAALVVAGVMAMWIVRRGEGNEPALKVVVWSARVALMAAVLQVLLGGYLLLQVPASIRDQLLGRDLVAAAAFAASVLAAILLMHWLATAAGGETTHGHVARCLLLTVLVMLLMAAVRHRTYRSLRVVPESVTQEQTAAELSLVGFDVRDRSHPRYAL